MNEHEAALKKQGNTYEFYRYDGAGHGIWYWHRPLYRPEQAMDRWARDPDRMDAQRMEAARGAAPYVHARLAHLEAEATAAVLDGEARPRGDTAAAPAFWR